LASSKATQETLDEMRAEAEREAHATGEHRLGRAGRPFDRHAPFLVGLLGALGVAVAAALTYAVVAVGQVLVLLALALVLAVGLDPAVVWLHRRGIPRRLAVVLVLLGVLGTFGLFLGLAIPVVITQATHLANHIPHYLSGLKRKHTTLGRLNAKYHIVNRLQKILRGNGSSIGTVLGAGKVALDLLASVLLVVILTIYLLADLPRVKRGLYRLAPRSRRARMVLITEEIFRRVGGYVLGDLFTSLVAGAGTWVWGLAFGIPYALLLGLLVALLDLIPIVGSTIGGVIVALVALTVSLPVAIATAAFYVVYRFVEDYLLIPRVMARTVAVPGLVTVLATVFGAALLGIIGAVVAIPVAATIAVLMDALAAPALDSA
jgi:predicted PurR-regulated permease PerM